MSFQDELNKNTKTPQDVDNDLRKSMDVKAWYEYSEIKEYMLLKVRRGEYTISGDKKCVTIYYDLHYDLKDLVKEEEIHTRQPTGFLNLRTRDLIQRRIVVDESRRKEYDYFIESITEYGRDDDIEITPVMYDRRKGIEYTIPTPIIGVYIFGYIFCLKCTAIY